MVDFNDIWLKLLLVSKQNFGGIGSKNGIMVLDVHDLILIGSWLLCPIYLVLV